LCVKSWFCHRSEQSRQISLSFLSLSVLFALLFFGRQLLAKCGISPAKIERRDL
jgi:hypothetical protein